MVDLDNLRRLHADRHASPAAWDHHVAAATRDLQALLDELALWREFMKKVSNLADTCGTMELVDQLSDMVDWIDEQRKVKS